jgi:serine O-acetyltransferase
LPGRRVPHPGFFDALLADASITAAYRNERWQFRNRADALMQAVRLMWRSDAFLAQTLYRAKARLQSLGVPVLPRLAHRLAILTAQLCVDDDVLIHPGVYIAHGQVVIAGAVEVHDGAVLFPWVTISQDGSAGTTTIGPRVQVGTGATVLGPLHVGAAALIGANALVVSDVPAGSTAVGSPARPIGAHRG